MFKKVTSQLKLMQLNAAAAASSSSSSSSAPLAAAASSSSSLTPTPGCFWLDRCKEHIKFHENRIKDQVQKLTVRPRQHVFMDPNAYKKTSGDVKLNNLNYWLNNMGVQRSPDQVLFHKHFTNACLPKIYGAAEWNENSVRVMDSLGIKKIRFEVTAITPRRWGKTWSVALFTLSLMLACPGIRICVFSTGKRASGALMEIILQFMGNRPDLKPRIVKENQEELYIADAALDNGASSNGSAARAVRQSDKTSKLFCYPCSVTGKTTKTQTLFFLFLGHTLPFYL